MFENSRKGLKVLLVIAVIALASAVQLGDPKIANTFAVQIALDM
jgi:hypothetical protein